MQSFKVLEQFSVFVVWFFCLGEALSVGSVANKLSSYCLDIFSEPSKFLNLARIVYSSLLIMP